MYRRSMVGLARISLLILSLGALGVVLSGVINTNAAQRSGSSVTSRSEMITAQPQTAEASGARTHGTLESDRGISNQAAASGWTLFAVLSRPESVAVDDTGYVYVTDVSNRQIHVLSRSSEQLASWSSGPLTAPVMPIGLAARAMDQVYVANVNRAVVQKWSSDGTLLAEWGPFGQLGVCGRGVGEPGVTCGNRPFGVAVDSHGDMRTCQLPGAAFGACASCSRASGRVGSKVKKDNIHRIATTM
jgi:hypothetical protein